MTRIILLMGILLLWPPMVSAEIYRWKDENGNWQFGDRAPQAGENHEEVQITPPALLGQGDSVNEIHQRTLRLRDVEQTERNAEKEAEDKERAAMAGACKEANDRLKRLNSRFVYVNDDGTERSASAQEVSEDIDNTKKWIKEHCV